MNPRSRRLMAWAVAIGVGALMVTSVLDTDAWATEGAGLIAGAGQLDPITSGLFDTHVFALEVLGVLLTAAMIGALVIARPVGAPQDESYYWSDPETREREPEMHEPVSLEAARASLQGPAATSPAPVNGETDADAPSAAPAAAPSPHDRRATGEGLA